MTTIKPTVPDVLPLVNAYVAKKGNGVGGVLHLVLANKNIDNSHIKFCLAQAIEKEDVDGIHLAGILLKMSKTQRLKICNSAVTPIPLFPRLLCSIYNKRKSYLTSLPLKVVVSPRR